MKEILRIYNTKNDGKSLDEVLVTKINSNFTFKSKDGNNQNISVSYNGGKYLYNGVEYTSKTKLFEILSDYIQKLGFYKSANEVSQDFLAKENEDFNYTTDFDSLAEIQIEKSEEKRVGDEIFKYGKNGSKRGLLDVLIPRTGVKFNFTTTSGGFHNVEVTYQKENRMYYFTISNSGYSNIESEDKPSLERNLAIALINLAFIGKDPSAIGSDITTLQNQTTFSNPPVDQEKVKQIRKERESEFDQESWDKIVDEKMSEGERKRRAERYKRAAFSTIKSTPTYSIGGTQLLQKETDEILDQLNTYKERVNKEIFERYKKDIFKYLPDTYRESDISSFRDLLNLPDGGRALEFGIPDGAITKIRKEIFGDKGSGGFLSLDHRMPSLKSIFNDTNSADVVCGVYRYKMNGGSSLQYDIYSPLIRPGDSLGTEWETRLYRWEEKLDSYDAEVKNIGLQFLDFLKNGPLSSTYRTHFMIYRDEQTSRKLENLDKESKTNTDPKFVEFYNKYRYGTKGCYKIFGIFN